MPDLDTELASVLRQAKAKPMHFAFVAKGASEGRLFAAKTPIPAKKVNQAKAEMRGGQIYKGRCFGEEGQMIFEVAKEPPGTLAKLLKKVISDSTGLMLRVEFRVNPDLEGAEPPAPVASEESPGPKAAPVPPPPPPPPTAKAPPPPPPPPPTTVGKAAVLARLKKLAPRYGAALARRGPEAPQLQALFAFTKTRIDQQSWAPAAQALDKLEPLVARVLAAPPPKKRVDIKKELVARLKALVPAYQAAVARQGPEAAALVKLFGAFQASLGQEKFDLAGKALTELERLVAQVGSATPPPPPPPPGPGEAVGPAQWQQRLAKLTPGLKQALQANGPLVGQIKQQFAQANGLAQKKDYGPALAGLDKLEGLLDAALKATAEAAKTVGPDRATVLRRLNALAGGIKTALAQKVPEAGRIQSLLATIKNLIAQEDFAAAAEVLNQLEPLVAGVKTGAAAGPTGSRVLYTQSRLRWDSTRKQVQAELQELEQAILADCQRVNADPNAPYEFDLADVAGKVKKLYTILEKLDERLIDKLDEALNAADPAQRQALQKEAAGIVKEYLGVVDSDPLLQVIDANGLTPAKVQQNLRTVLNDLASKL